MEIQDRFDCHIQRVRYMLGYDCTPEEIFSHLCESDPTITSSDVFLLVKAAEILNKEP